MQVTTFRSLHLVDGVAARARRRLAAEHHRRPFMASDARDAAQRAAAALSELPVEVEPYRGGLGLQGVEVDHVWLAVTSHAVDGAQRWVIDVAFPLYEPGFVTVLRRYVAGDAEADELDEAGWGAGLGQRVVGRFPEGMGYCGAPLWWRRRQRRERRR